MPGGLAALLDDVALIAKTASASIDDVAAAAGKTSAKATGIVVDDAAVTPRFVQGVTPARELPIIWRIAKGSLFNKLVIILPVALLLSWLAPWLLNPILMLGGAYLCFEGAEKVWEKISGHEDHEEAAVDTGPDAENKLVRGAVTTDLILSAEIMVISLNEVAAEPLAMRTIVLIIVAIGITALVYGVVGLLVKMDDVGMGLASRDSAGAQKLGRGMVAAMPRLLNIIAVIGTFAMLWVGGHLVIENLSQVGLSVFHHLLEGAVHAVSPLGAATSWVVETALSGVFGLALGAVLAWLVVGVAAAVSAMRGRHAQG